MDQRDLVTRAIPEISFRKTVTIGQHTLVTQNWLQNLLTVWHIQPAKQTQSVTGENDTVSKSTDKVAAFKAKLELCCWWVNIGIFDMFQTSAEILKETEPAPSFS